MNLFEVLSPEARQDLTRYGIVEIVPVSVKVVPDPDRPEDRLAMKIVAEVNDNFQPGIPAIDRELDTADEICSSSDDLALTLRDELLVTLETRRRELAELREGWSTADRLRACRIRRSRRSSGPPLKIRLLMPMSGVWDGPGGRMFQSIFILTIQYSCSNPGKYHCRSGRYDGFIVKHDGCAC